MYFGAENAVSENSLDRKSLLRSNISWRKLKTEVNDLFKEITIVMRLEILLSLKYSQNLWKKLLTEPMFH